MLNRIQKLSYNNDLFIFGARGTGKSTLIKTLFKSKKVLWIDLLTEADENRFGRNPDELSRHLEIHPYEYVVIDEVQKFPKLLDIVHFEIERKRKKRPYFILSGSSARKLKKNSANLLAGRAFNYYLFPFTHTELDSKFNLDEVLQFGSLPGCFQYSQNDKKDEYLRAYIRNYIKEEVLSEQILRKIEPFRDFLEVAAQSNTQIINYSKIARDVGVSDQTIKSFYSILEDTLLGFMLPPFHRSIRKRQREAPKFYFFDCGVQRALARILTLTPNKGTSEYGKSFEHLVIIETMRACEYYKNDFRLSYLRTKDDAEIDLIIERPGKADLLVEIKSKAHATPEDAKTLIQFQETWDKKVECQVWSLDKLEKTINKVKFFHWQDAMKNLFVPTQNSRG